ncbi:8121_t:CDS:1, partial [Funneliformis caledonium]
MEQRIGMNVAEQKCHETAVHQETTQRDNDNTIISDKPISATTI